jgi:hypothetical protein
MVPGLSSSLSDTGESAKMTVRRLSRRHSVLSWFAFPIPLDLARAVSRDDLRWSPIDIHKDSQEVDLSEFV